jgi:hypothetical protein
MSMSKRVSLLVVLAMLLAPLAARGQEKEPASVFIYATYFYCDVTGQDLVDEVAKTVYAPVYNAAVDDGTILSWGWMAHHVGGKWRRLLYRSAPSIDAVLAGADKIGEKIDENTPEAAGQVGRICNSHDDYIWRQVAGSAGEKGVQHRGKVGFSTYLVCDMAKEERADQLMHDVIAPIFSRYVTEGKLTSWGWMEHIVGGQYRRLESITAKDYPTLMPARGAMIEELTKNHKEASTEFDSICNSHQDYLWDTQQEKP